MLNATAGLPGTIAVDVAAGASAAGCDEDTCGIVAAAVAAAPTKAEFAADVSLRRTDARAVASPQPAATAAEEASNVVALQILAFLAMGCFLDRSGERIEKLSHTKEPSWSCLVCTDDSRKTGTEHLAMKTSKQICYWAEFLGTLIGEGQLWRLQAVQGTQQFGPC
jgi:hypothetical protein